MSSDHLLMNRGRFRPCKRVSAILRCPRTPESCERRCLLLTNRAGESISIFIRSVSHRLAQREFLAVFNLRFGNRLPLHVERIVGAARTQRDYVINNIAWTSATRLAGAWTMVKALECRFCAVATRLACVSVDAPDHQGERDDNQPASAAHVDACRRFLRVRAGLALGLSFPDVSTHMRRL